MIKKLLSHVGEYKKDTILTPILVIFEVGIEIFIPFLMAQIIDNGLVQKDILYIGKVGLLMIIISMLSLTFAALSGVTAAKASAGFAKNLREAIFNNIQKFSFSNLDKYSTSGLITRLTTDITNVQNAYQMIIRMFVRAPIMLISAVIMTVSINKKLSTVFLGSLLFLGIALFFMIKNAMPYFMKLFKTYDALNANVQENLTGIRVVKAYVREKFSINKFKNTSKNLYNYSVNAEKIVVLNMPLMQFTMYTTILLISWLGAKYIVIGEMTTGELMSMFTYTNMILMSLMMISMVFVMITMSKASAERISEVLDEKSDIVNKENPVYEVKNGDIEFKNVNFSYNKKADNCVLEDINLKIKQGEIVGIIGATGSSKTTLVQLIPRMYDVLSGSITVGGVDVRDYDIKSLRDSVSMVLQKNVLFSGTINENIRWGNKDATEQEIIDVCKIAQADSFIQNFEKGYDTFIEQGGNNVSGGQKQRLCIARAILKKPKVLILDDSTSAVDTKTDSLIKKGFRESLPNTTKIIISQRISSIQDADKIIVLNDGKISGIGTHEELIENNDIYSEIYSVQKKGDDFDECR